MNKRIKKKVIKRLLEEAQEMIRFDSEQDKKQFLIRAKLLQ